MPTTNSEQALWTVSIQGGAPFSMHLPGNPAFEHTGGTSVAHLVLTKEEARTIRGLARIHNCHAEGFRMAGQTDDQAEERAAFVALGDQEDRVWPSIGCPTCPWFDPLLPGFPCGEVGWPRESSDTLLETSDLHKEALGECEVDRNGNS